ncbi:MAG: hypothetical protein ACYTBJ_20535 [Planctomycetota bacterium]|jgi:hypothetical protein
MAELARDSGLARLAGWFLIAAVSCCPVTLSGQPGDEGAVGWEPYPEPTEWRELPCPTFRIRESGTVLRDCEVNGSIRIGKWRNAKDGELYWPSRTPDYVSWIRGQSVNHVRLERVTIRASGHVGLYVGPGVTSVTVSQSWIGGDSGTGPTVYLGAESSRVTLDSVTVDGSGAGREAVAIDASDFATVSNSTIIGGIHAYRNCGESGTIRHTTPSDGAISDSAVDYVWLNSRNGARCYCDHDAGWPYGSSQSDLDHARRWAIQKPNQTR